jgi:hypothetical protein
MNESAANKPTAASPRKILAAQTCPALCIALPNIEKCAFMITPE